MHSAYGPATPQKWWRDPASANEAQSAANNLAIPLRQIAFCSMYLDAVKSGLTREPGGPSIIGKGLGDLIFGHGHRRLVLKVEISLLATTCGVQHR